MDQIIPYCGEEDYIFVSYAHKDSERVAAFLKQMQDDGYRIWFDEGIEIGSSWSDNIASHLEACRCLIVFMSENYLASANCKNELLFSLDLNKKILRINLEDVKLSGGLALRLNLLQAVNWTKRADERSVLRKLGKSEDMSLCRSNILSEMPEQTDSSRQNERVNNRGGKANHQWLIPLCVVGLLVLIMVALLFWQGRTDAKAPVVQTVLVTATPKPEKNPEPVRFTLRAPKDMSVSEFNEAVEIVRTRLAALCGNRQYKMSVENDLLRVEIPVEVFGTASHEDILTYCIAGTGALGLLDSEYSIDNEWTDALALPRTAVEQVNREYREFPDQDGEYPCPLIKLLKEYTEENQELISLWTAPTFGLFEGGKCKSSFTTELKQSSGEILLCGELFEQCPTADALMETLITQPPLSQPLELSLEIWADWEDPTEMENPGAYQCTPEELPDNTVTLLYESRSANISVGEWLDTSIALRTRLDSLETPYAIGSGREEHSVVVRMPTDDLSALVEKTLPINYNSLELRGAKYSMYLEINSAYSGIEDYELQKLDDGSVKLLIHMDEGGLEKRNALGTKEDALCLFCGGCYVNVVSAAFSDDGVVLAADAENAWVITYLITCQSMPLSCTLSLSDSQFSEGSSYGQDLYGWNKTVLTTLQDTFQAYEIQAQEEEIIVKLHLPVNENLPETSIREAMNIYEAAVSGGFLDYPLGTLSLYLVDETDREIGDQQPERGRIFIHRRLNYYETEKNEGLYTSGIFSGGRLSAYEDTFYELLDAESFFTETSDRQNDWFYRSRFTALSTVSWNN